MTTCSRSLLTTLCSIYTRYSLSHRLFIQSVPCTLNTQDKEVQLTRDFVNICQLHQLIRAGDVVLDVVQDGGDKTFYCNAKANQCKPDLLFWSLSSSSLAIVLL